MNGRFSLVQSTSGIVRETIRIPFELAFKVGERLALVLDPSGRDVNVGNSQVLDRIDFDLLGKVSQKRLSPNLDRCG